MRYFVLTLLLIPTLILCKTSQSFKVKLIDYSTDKIPAYCGVIAFATTLKFELLENADPLKKGQNILVIIICPRELGIEHYVNNHQYELTVYGNSKQDKKLIEEYPWTIFNKYENEKHPGLWCKELKIINE